MAAMTAPHEEFADDAEAKWPLLQDRVPQPRSIAERAAARS